MLVKGKTRKRGKQLEESSLGGPCLTTRRKYDGIQSPKSRQANNPSIEYRTDFSKDSNAKRLIMLASGGEDSKLAVTK